MADGDRSEAPSPNGNKSDAQKKLSKKELKREKKRAQEQLTAKQRPPMPKREYEKELQRLQTELVKLQYWVKHKGLAPMDLPAPAWRLPPPSPRRGGRHGAWWRRPGWPRRRLRRGGR